LRYWGKLKRKSTKGLTVIEVVVITSIVIALGIFLMMYSAGLFTTTTLDLTEETSRNIQLLRGILLIEAVHYYSREDGTDAADIYVRNIAKHPIDLTVTRIELIISHDVLHDYVPKSSVGFGNLTKLKMGENASLSAPVCNQCKKGDILIYRVWYISSFMYNVENPLMSVNDMLYVEAKIIKPIGGGSPLKCPLPIDNWVMIDYIDPITGAIFGRIGSLSPAISIRPSLASSQSDDLSFTVTAIEIEGGGSGSGSAEIDIPTARLERVVGDYENLQVPLRVTVTSSWNVIQREWIFGGISGKLHISGIYLQWSRLDKILEGVMLELGYGETGNYRVKITLKDCDGEVLMATSVYINVERTNDFEARFIPIPDPIRFDQIYYIETEVEELSGGH